MVHFNTDKENLPMSVKIIVDSTSDIRSDIKERLTVVPLTVHFGEQEYVDGVTITHK